MNPFFSAILRTSAFVKTVDTATGEAYKRPYTVSPGTEGDDANIYKYSGSFKANGEQVKGTATTSDEWATVSFSATT